MLTLPADAGNILNPTFSVVRVEDARSGSAGMGVVLTAPEQTVPVRLTASVQRTLGDLLKPNFRAAADRVPVIIKINEFRFVEYLRNDGKVEGRFRTVLNIETTRDGTTLPLTKYTADLRYVRSLSQTKQLSGIVRSALQNATIYISEWISENRDKSPALVKGLKFVFKDHIEQAADSDTVFYSPDRLLTWADFTGKPRGGRLGAAIYASFAYEGRSRWENGYLVVELTFRTFMLKSMSWVSPTVAVAGDYSLLHEQRHFDVVKLVVERFKQQILIDDDMTIEDYNSRIQYLYLDAYRDMNRRQERYDDDTRHGLVQSEQYRWNQKIIDELRRAEEQTRNLLAGRQ